MVVSIVSTGGADVQLSVISSDRENIVTKAQQYYRNAFRNHLSNITVAVATSRLYYIASPWPASPSTATAYTAAAYTAYC
jgi:hypothetical protein